MSSHTDLRVSQSVVLLAGLQTAIASFAKREEALVRDIATRRSAASRKQRDGLARVETTLSEGLAAIEAAYQGEEQRIRTLYANRRARIERGYASGIKTVARRARAEKDKYIGELQMRHLKAERNLPRDLKAADKEAADFAAALAEQQVALANAEASAWKGFSGYDALQRLLRRENPAPAGDGAPAAPPADGATARDHTQLAAELQARLSALETQLLAFRALPLPRLFSAMPLSIWMMAIGLIAVVLAFGLAFSGGTTLPVAGAIAGTFAVVFALAVLAIHRAGLQQGKLAAAEIASAIADAHRLHDAARDAAAAKHAADHQRIQGDYDRTWAEINEQWGRGDDVERRASRKGREKIEKQMLRVRAKNEKLLSLKLPRVAPDRAGRTSRLQADADAQRQQITEAHRAEITAIALDETARWTALETEWKRDVLPLFETAAKMNAVAEACFPEWTEQNIYAWEPPVEFMPATKFGRVELDLSRPGALPKDPRLALPGAPLVSVPLSLAFPMQGSLLFETADSGNPVVIATLNNIILRLLATTPPGKLTFTIIDPVGLGQNFAGLMHLGDYEESLINRRIWTQRDQIEERLAELNEHIEKVIQMYLRTEFATITEYNEQAGSVAEKYHFVVVADFPASFSETAAKRLQSLAVSGPRCGVYTLIHRDTRQTPPDGFLSDELRASSVVIHRDRADGWVIDPELAKAGATISFDTPPELDLAASLIHQIGKRSVDSNRVEVPFSQIAPAPAERWTQETTSELRIAIGRTGATKHQILAIGKGTRQHALFAGKTGSGKSTLFHVIITNLALACPPDQVEFYLIDFKKGVEFKCYAEKRLPHARVVAIESDREFALSVLQRVDEELKRRGDLFRKLGVQDIPGYKRAGGTEPMPRSLLIIDEFQEFFVEDDVVAQSASLLFDRIVRQGRAFGIHVLLGSQTLGGAYTLARATLGQMVIRVALQCNEADAYLIMDDNNPAPRLLSRPGEGIYNDAAGAVEGNSPFQVVWLGDDERDRLLEEVHGLAEQRGGRFASPVVFEGNAPADIRENDLLRDALAAAPAKVPPIGRCWLGAPNSIKGPTEADFTQQSGNHLLIVGQRDEAVLTMMGMSLLSLAAQYPVGGARFYVLHSVPPGTQDAEFLDHILAAVLHGVTVARGNNEVADVMNELAGELKSRAGGSSANGSGEQGVAESPATFILIHGLQRFKKLRQEDDFSFSVSDSDGGGNPAAQLTELISEGSSHGIHLLVAVDTFNNINRFLSRKALTEFEMRVLFQMSANDSASLIDSPKASNLGLHRAVLYNEHAGTLETFRPYAAPDNTWLEEAAAKLAPRRNQEGITANLEASVAAT